MSTLLEFEDDVQILVEVAPSTRGAGGGVGAVSAGEEIRTHKVAKTFEQSLGMIGQVVRSVRSTLKNSEIDEAEVRIGFKASGTGQFVIAATTVEAAIEVTFKVKSAS